MTLFRSDLNLHVVLNLLLTFALALVPDTARAWGGDGHRIVAWIAEAELTESVRREIRELLRDDLAHTLAATASWADFVISERPETRPWHYVDIPLDADGYRVERDCIDGQCVVARIAYFAQTLANDTLPRVDRREALKFLVHFVGDMHQPLHCANHADKGGNKTEVLFYGEPTNLHHVWDTALIDRFSIDPRTLARGLQAGISGYSRKKWVAGSLEDWANESHQYARAFAYGALPDATPPQLGDEYLDMARPIVERQLQRAGVRLARILRESLTRK